MSLFNSSIIFFTFYRKISSILYTHFTLYQKQHFHLPMMYQLVFILIICYTFLLFLFRVSPWKQKKTSERYVFLTFLKFEIVHRWHFRNTRVHPQIFVEFVSLHLYFCVQCVADHCPFSFGHCIVCPFFELSPRITTLVFTSFSYLTSQHSFKICIPQMLSLSKSITIAVWFVFRFLVLLIYWMV